MPDLNDIKEAQRKTWNKFSAGWRKWDAFVLVWLGPTGEAMLDLAMLKDGMKVLDVATGTGEPGLSAARRIKQGQVTGVDVAEDMVRIAGEKARAAGLSNFKAQSYDGLKLPFADGIFDALLCRYGVIFFPDMGAGVRDLARVVRAGGRMAVSGWLEGSRNPWASIAGKIVIETLGLPPPAPDAPGIFRCARPGTLKGLLEGAGLGDCVEREVSSNVAFRSMDHYWEFLMDVVAPVSSALSAVTPEQVKNVRSRLEDAVAGFIKQGALEFPWASWVAAGTKN